MKTPRFSSSIFLVSIALLVLLGPNSLWPPMAQARPAYRVTPASASDQAHLSTVLRSAPLMFIENVGQFDRRARFQVRTDRATLYLTESELWLTLLAPAEEATEGQSCSGVADRRSPVEDALSEMPSGVLGSPRPPCAPAPRPRRGLALKLTFPGANPHPRLEPFNRLETHVSYFIGNDPARWRTDVPVWGGARYVDLYPGLDLEINGAGGEWTWRLVAQPGAEEQRGRGAEEHSSAPTPLRPGSEVRLQVEGAEALALDGNRLRLTTPLGEFSLPLLQAVAADGTPLDLPGTRPVIAGRAVRAPFVTPQANLQLSTPQSPQDNPNDLVYSTFLGGSNFDFSLGVAVDGAGNAYVTGGTRSADFPTTAGAFDTSYEGGTCGTPPDTYPCEDVFVVKLNPGGTGVAYATFLGGSGYDIGSDIVVDEAGNAYVLGWTRSTNFPATPGAFDTSYNGRQDAFVVKLNTTGTGLVYATFLGGSDSSDFGEALTVDGVGNAYVTGYTYSSDFPTTAGAFDTALNWGDAFVVKLNTTGTGLVYATFLGGGDFDFGHRIAVDGTGSAYVTGRTYSPDFPTTAGAFDTSYNGGDFDAFMVKLNTAGTGLVYATFLGGSNDDAGLGVAMDGTGNAYVTGYTYSSNFPTTAGAFDVSHNGQGDIFVVNLNTAGTGLVYATFLGGSGFDVSWTVAVDGMGSAHVTGQTVSADFPITVGAFDASHNGLGDIFVVKLNTVGTELAYATFLGGSASDSNFNRGIALDEAGNIYVAGQTESADFPTTTSAFDTSYNGDSDSFVTKLTLRPNLSLSTKQASTVRVTPGQLVTYTVTLSNIGGNDAPSAHLTDTLPTSLIYQPGSLGANTGSYGQAGGVITWAGSLVSGESAVVRYTVMVSPGLSISETAALLNTARLDDGVNTPFERAAVVFVNPQEIYLPLITKR